MTPPSRLSLHEQIGYATGMLGWSILTNIITVMLIYFYLPPSNARLISLVPQIAVFGIFTTLSLVVAGGRLFDAVTDPLIAYMSDGSSHPQGRRLPFMRLAILPAMVFAFLFFTPLEWGESTVNLWWLAGVQAGFYLSLTIYIVPYNALLPELSDGPQTRIRLSAWLSMAFVLGMIVSSQAPALADHFELRLNLPSRIRAFQWSVGTLTALAGLCMAVPLFSIKENRLTGRKEMTITLTAAIREALSVRNYRIFIAADFAYFVSLTIISSGMLYFVSTLLGLPDAIGGQVMGVMVLMSLVFYPLVIRLADKVGKRLPMLLNLVFLGLLMIGISQFGKLPISPRWQIFGFALATSIPLAFLGILPYAVIAEIAEQDARRTGQPKEAMYFAFRNLTTKMGQTLGIMTFAILTLLGKDPEHDTGIRLAAISGGLLCLLAAVLFSYFREGPRRKAVTETKT